jgi:hypothetical protein
MGRMRGRPGWKRQKAVSFIFLGVEPLTLTEAPTTIKRVEDLIAKEDAEYPKGPTCNVCDGAQDPVTTRTRYSGGFRIRELCNSTNKSN